MIAPTKNGCPKFYPTWKAMAYHDAVVRTSEAWGINPNLFFRTFRSRLNLRSPFYTHESGKRTKPGRIKRAPCDSQQRLGGSPGWVKCGDWKAARFSFLSSYVSVCRFNYLLYLLLWCLVFIIVIIFSKVYLSVFDCYVFLICFFFDWLGETSITRTRKWWCVLRGKRRCWASGQHWDPSWPALIRSPKY